MEISYNMFSENPLQAFLHLTFFIIFFAVGISILIKVLNFFRKFRTNLTSDEFIEIIKDFDYEFDNPKIETDTKGLINVIKAKSPNSEYNIDFLEFSNNEFASEYYQNIDSKFNPDDGFENTGTIIRARTYWYDSDIYNALLIVGKAVIHTSCNKEYSEEIEKMLEIFLIKEDKDKKNKDLSL